MQTFPWLLLAACVSPLLLAQQPTQKMIRTAVEYKLMQEKIIRSDDVTVQIEDGQVTLQGRVASVALAKRAERVASGVPGVRTVRNELKVDMQGEMPDGRIAEAVSSAIRSSVWFDIFDWVEGEVNNGVVTLRGAVREPWRRGEFGRLAEAVRGAAQVDNQIKALPLSSYDDSLRIQIAQAIYGNPAFTRYANRSLPPIHIVVDSGRVTLQGAVATELEKQMAGVLANQSDALAVTNQLQVSKN